MQPAPRRRSALTILATSLALAACGAEPAPAAAELDGVSSRHGTLVGSFSPAPDPPATGDNALAMRLARASGAPVVGAVVQLEPWMPAHGHGSPTVPTVVEVGGGAYRAEAIHLTMPGHWELAVLVDPGDGADVFLLDFDVK